MTSQNQQFPTQAVPLVWSTRWIVIPLYPLLENVLYTRLAVKWNCIWKYFIQYNAEVKNNPHFLVLQKSHAKDGLLPFKIPQTNLQ